MLIVSEVSEAVNAHHTVRFFLQCPQVPDTYATSNRQFRLVLQLTNRQRVVVAENLPEPIAQALFKELVRAWTRGQSCFEVGTALRRIEKGESGGNGRTEVCL